MATSAPNLSHPTPQQVHVGAQELSSNNTPLQITQQALEPATIQEDTEHMTLWQRFREGGSQDDMMQSMSLEMWDASMESGIVE